MIDSELIEYGQRDLRYKTDIKVSFLRADFSSNTAILNNISSGGICLICEKPEDVGSVVYIHLPLETNDPLQLKGHVTWVNRALPSEMGIKFCFESESAPQQKSLEMFIQQLVKELP